MPEIKTTQRGFLDFDQVDGCHHMPGGLQVRESSSAGNGAHLWVFFRGECTDHLGKHSTPAAHLSVAAVKTLIAQLTGWVAQVEGGNTMEAAGHDEGEPG